MKANPQFRDGTNLLAQILIDEKKCPEAVQVITETMLRDLESCRRLCETLRRRARLQPVA